MTVTSNMYSELQGAYDHFNKALFNDKLPECLLTIAHQRAAYGYFRGKAFADRKKAKKIVHEISLNPQTFAERSDREILSTLVHEMVHLWQHAYGKPKKTHHDKEWANKMEELGLMPTSTGEEGGKRTGRRVTHYIIDKGGFDKAEKKCKNKIRYVGRPADESGKKSRKRTKYTCPTCEANVYGKKELHIKCGSCKETMEQN